MRLNRSNAQFRDRDRAGTSGKGNIQDQACAYVWKELVGKPLRCFILKRSYILVLCLENWKRRTEMINYCVDIVDQSMEEKRKSLTSEEGDARAQRKTQAAMFADEVKVRKVSACNSFSHKPICREIKFTMN